MSELIGLVQSGPDPHCAHAFGGMCDSLNASGGSRFERNADPSMHWFAGTRRAEHLSIDERGLHVYALGSVIDRDEELDPLATARLIARRYDEAGLQLGSLLEGQFLAAIIDDANRRVLLVNDLLGTYSLYWHHRQRLVFGS